MNNQTLTHNIAKETNNNETSISNITAYEDFATFTINNTPVIWSVSLTKSGKVKKNSLRRLNI